MAINIDDTCGYQATLLTLRADLLIMIFRDKYWSSLSLSYWNYGTKGRGFTLLFWRVLNAGSDLV